MMFYFRIAESATENGLVATWARISDKDESRGTLIE
jgi:hypothetical protein